MKRIERGDIIQCSSCYKKDVVAFTATPPRRWSGDWEYICEPCAEKIPDFYYRYIDYGGTYSPFDGTKDEVESNLKRILEEDGKNGLREVEVYSVPGKFKHHSDVDKRKFGKQITVYSDVTGKVKVA